MQIKKPSKYQKEIYKVYNTTNKNIFISAGPGSGKTTTSIEMVNQTPLHKKIWMSAFNKSIAEELKSRVRPGFDVSTLHSRGISLLRANTSCKLNLKEIKTWIWGKQLFNHYLQKKFKNDKDRSVHLFTLSRMYDLYRMNLAELTEDSLMSLSDMYNVGLDEDSLEQTVKLISVIEDYNDSKSDELTIDYTDMLWLPHKFLKQSDYPRYAVVFIDEVQDVNPLQKRLIDNIIGKSGRFVAVGDERQAIYSFMGSNLNSLNAFKNAPNTVSLPLSVSYRCAKKIVEEANKVFPGIEPAENAPEGIVRYGSIDEIRPGDFVICRNNLPLTERYIDLLGVSKKSYILGKDFGKSLTELLTKVDKIDDLNTLLSEKKKKLEGRGVQNITGNAGYVSLMEKCQIIRILYNRTGSLDKVKTMLEGMFAEDSEVDKKNSIILSTGHRAKGLESERVFWINPELIPSKYAQTDLELYQEQCLKYVIITRAKSELVIVKGGEQYEVPNMVIPDTLKD